MDELQRLLEELRRRSDPELMLLYGTKRDVAKNEVKDIDVCLVLETDDKDALTRRLYLEVDSDLSYDLIVYTPAEWDTLVSDPLSFAHRILEKGTVVYEREKK